MYVIGQIVGITAKSLFVRFQLHRLLHAISETSKTSTVQKYMFCWGLVNVKICTMKIQRNAIENDFYSK